MEIDRLFSKHSRLKRHITRQFEKGKTAIEQGKTAIEQGIANNYIMADNWPSPCVKRISLIYRTIFHDTLKIKNEKKKRKKKC